jgi:hypothetical protein
VVGYDRDQQPAGAIYRLYRRVRALGQVSRSAPLSVDRAVGRRALLSHTAEDAGAPTPRLRALTRAGPEASVLAYEHREGRPLAQQRGRRSWQPRPLAWLGSDASPSVQEVMSGD